MRLTETLRMFWTNLLQNKSKVLLTSLGIIIGTLTIILVIAIGKGGEEEVARQYSSMSYTVTGSTLPAYHASPQNT